MPKAICGRKRLMDYSKEARFDQFGKSESVCERILLLNEPIEHDGDANIKLIRGLATNLSKLAGV